MILNLPFQLFLRSFIVLVFIANSLSVSAQNSIISGQVFGFNSEKVFLIKKANKNLGFEGPLDKVKITLTDNTGRESEVYTDFSGNYSIVMPGPGEYLLRVGKAEFSEVTVKLNNPNKGYPYNFHSCNFLLKKSDASKNDLGSVYASATGVLTYQFSDLSKEHNPDVMQSNKILMEKFVDNVTRHKFIPKTAPTIVVPTPKTATVATAVTATIAEKKEEGAAMEHHQKINELNQLLNAGEAVSMEDYKAQLEKMKEALRASGLSEENMAVLKGRIEEAEHKIKLKEDLIRTQEENISNSRKVILFISFFAVALVAAAGLGFWLFSQKKKFSFELLKKNREIENVNRRMVSNLKYASVIQENLHADGTRLKDLFPNSFVHNSPKDYLSGDFFWCSKYKGLSVVALADCTGHGVPGALLTVLGQRFLRQLTEEENITSPSVIIHRLEDMIIHAFKDENQVEYGIELGVLAVADNSKTIQFASNGILLYLYENGQLNAYEPKYTPVRSGETVLKPEDMSFTLNNGDCIFMSSDGYADQFGKPENRKRKFGLVAFKKLLRELAEAGLTDGDRKLKATRDDWKGNTEQTDDNLIIGIRI